MIKRSLLSLIVAMLMISVATVGAAPRSTAAARSSAKKKKVSTSKNKKKKKAKTTVHGQKAPTSDRVREIQSALNREGVLEGEPTGKWDGASVAAMKKYQTAHGLNPTGKIDAVTLEKLGFASETAGKGAPFPVSSSTQPATSTH